MQNKPETWVDAVQAFHKILDLCAHVKSYRVDYAQCLHIGGVEMVEEIDTVYTMLLLRYRRMLLDEVRYLEDVEGLASFVPEGGVNESDT